jgi:hypothetical protein
MAIRSDIDFGLIAVGTSDTTVIQLPFGVERVGVTAASVHNTTGANRVLTLWESPNLTSASGSVIAEYTVLPDSSVDIQEVLGQGYENTNIIAQASSAGLNFRSSGTTYTDGD